MRALVTALILAATSLFAADRAEPLTGKELEEFLGPVSPHVLRWTKLTATDFDRRPVTAAEIEKGIRPGGSVQVLLLPNDA